MACLAAGFFNAINTIQIQLPADFITNTQREKQKLFCSKKTRLRGLKQNCC
jgi:hypothetical protein